MLSCRTATNKRYILRYEKKMYIMKLEGRGAA